jgi:hypothetical protein
VDVETAQKEFDRISQKSRRSLEDFTRQGELRKVIKPEELMSYHLNQCLIL